MMVIVESEEEAIELARKISHICNDIRNSNIADILQSAYENTLCQIRDAIEVKKEGA